MAGVYLYQTVHVLDGVCLHLAAHVALLDGWARTLFGHGFRPDEAELARQIVTLARQMSPAPCRTSQFVRIVVPAASEAGTGFGTGVADNGAGGMVAEGRTVAGSDTVGQPCRLEFAAVSLYRGYDLRTLRPDAVSLQYDLPAGDAPTSAREAVGQLVRTQVRLHGATSVVRCGSDGIAYTVDDAPLLAVRGRRVFISPAEASVERGLALRAVVGAGLEMVEAPVERAELARFDELLYVDYRGVTALAHCDGHPYMDILAGRIARAMRGVGPI